MASAALNSERLLSARLRYVFCNDVDGGSEKLGIWEIPGSKVPIRFGKYYILIKVRFRFFLCFNLLKHRKETT